MTAYGAEVEFTQFGTKVKFYEEDFEKNGGQSFPEGWGLLRSNKWRGKCFVTTSPIDLLSSGTIFVTVHHKTSWHGFLETLDEAWDVELFTIKVRYINDDGDSVLKKKYVSLIDIPNFRQIYDGRESDYFRAETQTIKSINLDEAIEVLNSATNIEVAICTVGPGTKVVINQIDLETDAIIEDQ